MYVCVCIYIYKQLVQFIYYDSPSESAGLILFHTFQRCVQYIIRADASNYTTLFLRGAFLCNVLGAKEGNTTAIAYGSKSLHFSIRPDVLA